jgi:hypothetical protein
MMQATSAVLTICTRGHTVDPRPASSCIALRRGMRWGRAGHRPLRSAPSAARRSGPVQNTGPIQFTWAQTAVT